MDRWKIAAIPAALLIGIAIGWNLDAVGGKTTKIGWKFGDSELKIDLRKDMSSPDSLLGKIFSEEFSRLGTIELLKSRYDIYPFDDPAVVKKISGLSIDDPVSIKLRELLENRRGPFAYQVDTVRIGIPLPQDQPPVGYANVCKEGKYKACKIRILHLESDKEIEVEGSRTYRCLIEERYPDIQLNIEDAKELFGGKEPPKHKFEAMAIILE